MLPPPGLEPSASVLASAVATTASFLSIGVDIPSPTIINALATATATALAEFHEDRPSGPPDNGECRLLGPFAILVQGALGCLALLSLVYKRWRERPQRPLKIWFFDVSKQVVGSVLVHIANLLMSMLSSGQFTIKLDPGSVAQRRMLDENGNYVPNPCSFYLLNLAIDTTIGIPILIVLLRILTALFAMTPLGKPRESIESGNYDSPPRAWWWVKQSLIYFIGLMGMKICVLIIFLVLPWISRVGDWALGWTEGDTVLQVLFVMLIFPLIMNATQYYIIDTFIKKREHGHERLDGEDSDVDSDGGDSIFNDPVRDSMESRNEEDPEVKDKASASTPPLGSTGGKKPRTLQTGSKDYDPLYDGESSPTVVGSASTTERE